jgi:hypothetical protein
MGTPSITFLKATELLNSSTRKPLPSTKEQREYLVNELAPSRGLHYKDDILHICSEHFGGRIIKDVTELKYDQINQIIEKVKNMRIKEYEWNKYHY